MQKNPSNFYTLFPIKSWAKKMTPRYVSSMNKIHFELIYNSNALLPSLIGRLCEEISKSYNLSHSKFRGRTSKVQVDVAG